MSTTENDEDHWCGRPRAPLHLPLLQVGGDLVVGGQDLHVVGVVLLQQLPPEDVRRGPAAGCRVWRGEIEELPVELGVVRG